jgi:hypothetical protein
VVGVVASVVGEIDAAHERDVARRVVAVPDHDELLVVRATRADAHVEQDLGAAVLQLLAQMPVLGGEEALSVGASARPGRARRRRARRLGRAPRRPRFRARR